MRGRGAPRGAKSGGRVGDAEKLATSVQSLSQRRTEKKKEKETKKTKTPPAVLVVVAWLPDRRLPPTVSSASVFSSKSTIFKLFFSFLYKS